MKIIILEHVNKMLSFGTINAGDKHLLIKIQSKVN